MLGSSWSATCLFPILNALTHSSVLCSCSAICCCYELLLLYRCKVGAGVLKTLTCVWIICELAPPTPFKSCSKHSTLCIRATLSYSKPRRATVQYCYIKNSVVSPHFACSPQYSYSKLTHNHRTNCDLHCVHVLDKLWLIHKTTAHREKGVKCSSEESDLSRSSLFVTG